VQNLTIILRIWQLAIHVQRLLAFDMSGSHTEDQVLPRIKLT